MNAAYKVRVIVQDATDNYVIIDHTAEGDIGVAAVIDKAAKGALEGIARVGAAVINRERGGA